MNRKFSLTGMTIAVICLVMFGVDLVMGEMLILAPLLSGVVLLIRSFRLPLDWKRGLATWAGGWLAGSNLDMTILSGGFRDATEVTAMVFILLISALLVWIGF